MSASTDRLLRYLGLSSIFFCVFQRLVEVSPHESRGIICGQRPVNAGVVIRFLWIIQVGNDRIKVPPFHRPIELSTIDSIDLQETLSEAERKLLFWAYQKTNGNQVRMSEILRIPRTTLQNKLVKYNITKTNISATE